MSRKLTTTEADRLAECERIIERGQQTVVDIGRALARIRDERLYRATHKTFEAYVRDRWSWGRSHAYRLIDAAEIIERIQRSKRRGGVPSKPPRESAVRPLKTLPEEYQIEAYDRATDLARSRGRSVPTRQDTSDAVGEYLTASEASSRTSIRVTATDSGWSEALAALEADVRMHVDAWRWDPGVLVDALEAIARRTRLRLSAPREARQ